MFRGGVNGDRMKNYLVTEKIGTEFIKGKISNKPIRCQVSPQTLLAPNLDPAPNFSNEDW